MEPTEICALLNQDIRGEHMAIIQYLLHAYAIGESGEACEIEGIARDEMRHLKWLSETVVELGGTPTLERDPVDTSGAAPPDWMARDVGAEQNAIDLYVQHIAAIDDPEVVLLLQRILRDEYYHQGKFGGLGQELGGEGRQPVGPIRPEDATAASSRPLEILLEGIQHEYTVVLQYLFHSFTTPDCEIAEEMEDQAINEMQHMGWFGEEAASRGAFLAMEHTAVDQSRETAAMLRADIAAEEAVTKVYDGQIQELEGAGEEKLAGLIGLIRDHEVYHDALFGGLLKKLSVPEAPAAPEGLKWTVGSLSGERQE